MGELRVGGYGVCGVVMRGCGIEMGGEFPYAIIIYSDNPYNAM